MLLLCCMVTNLLALGTQGYSPMRPSLKVCPLQAHLFGSNLIFSSLLRLDPDSLFLTCTIRSWCLLGFCILALPCTRVSLCTGPFLGSFLFDQSVYSAPTQPILTSHRLFLVFLGGGKVLILHRHTQVCINISAVSLKLTSSWDCACRRE